MAKLSESEQKAIRDLLKHCRIVPLNRPILQTYFELRKNHIVAGKEDCLIAATALVKHFPLATRNYRHYRVFRDLKLYFRR